MINETWTGVRNMSDYNCFEKALKIIGCTSLTVGSKKELGQTESAFATKAFDPSGVYLCIEEREVV